MCEKLQPCVASTNTWENFLIKLTFNEIYYFLEREKFLNTNQYGFQPTDS